MVVWKVQPRFFFFTLSSDIEFWGWIPPAASLSPPPPPLHHHLPSSSYMLWPSLHHSITKRTNKQKSQIKPSPLSLVVWHKQTENPIKSCFTLVKDREKEEVLLNTQADIKHWKKLQDKSCNQSPVTSVRHYSLLTLLTHCEHWSSWLQIRFQCVTICFTPFFFFFPFWPPQGSADILVYDVQLLGPCDCVWGCLFNEGSSRIFGLFPTTQPALISLPNLSRFVWGNLVHIPTAMTVAVWCDDT